MLSVAAAAAAAAQESCSEHAREIRAGTRVHSVTGLGAILVLAFDINSGISLSYLQRVPIHLGW